MTTCPAPNCGQEHKGPRTADQIHLEACHVLSRAHDMPMGDVEKWLRVNFLRMGLELSGYCPSCVLEGQVAVAGAINVLLQRNLGEEPVSVEVRGPTLQAGEVPPTHTCLVYGLDSYRNRPRRDLLDISTTYDSERKP